MFCIHCGKELEENGICDCIQDAKVTNTTESHTVGDIENTVNTVNSAAISEETSEDITPQPETNNPETGQEEARKEDLNGKAGFDKDAVLSDVNEKFQKTAAVLSEEAKGLFKLIPPILKTPADGIKAYIETARTATGLQLIGAKALITALLLLITLIRIESSFGGWYTIPKAKPFFMTLVFLFALDYAFGWILYFFTTTVFKGTATPQKMTALSGLRCLPEIAAIAAGSIGFIIWDPLGIIIYVTLFILSITYLAEGYQHAATIDRNKWVYAVSASYGAFVVVSLLAMRLIAGDFIGSLFSFGNLF